MSLRNISNTNIVNLQNCDEEPIHIPGSIQPHGFLLALDNDGVIRFCSENVTAFLGMSPSHLLGTALSGLVNEQDEKRIKKFFVADQQKTNYRPVAVSVNGKGFSCQVNHCKAHFLLEFEPLSNSNEDSADFVFDQTVRFINYMEGSMTLQQLCAKVAEETRTLTGYDRVMIYRFDKDYSGEVFAESKREDIEGFFGLRYPATDIPVQARKLYETNLLRMIPDIAYTPVPMLTREQGDNSLLDMSFSVLRSVSPIHVQYLLNMGVGATLTISLMHKGKLWGLIACHHYEKKYIDHNTRVLAQLQGHFITSQIDVRQQAEEYAMSREMNQAKDELSNMEFEPTQGSISLIASQPQLLHLCNATGVAILKDKDFFTQGRTPTEEQVRQLANWLTDNNRLGHFHTHHLSSVFPPASSYCGSASGIIFHSLSIHPQACIIWFNQETLEEVKWGGDPEKAIIKDEKGLHPRKSFDLWKQVIQCKAREWRGAELMTANTFANTLQKHLSLVLITEEERAQRELSEKLRQSNLELENINWIGTHDLKEPLRKIQVFTSRLLEKEEGLTENVQHSLGRVNAAAHRMSQLINDLTTLGKLNSQGGETRMVNMAECLDEVQSAFSEEIEEGKGVFTIAALPDVKGIPILLRQLWMNLVGNAIKFRKEGQPVQIEIGYKGTGEIQDLPGQQYHIIYIRDNGIGFEAKFGTEVFKIFKRLHATSRYEGSGIGLALCKKIMQIHDGHIEVSSRPGEGAKFQLYFPI